MEEKVFKCPLCHEELVPNGFQRIETLMDHVCDPNGEGSFQETFACPNRKCSSHGVVFYDNYGEVYVDDWGAWKDSFSDEERDEMKSGPLGSLQRSYYDKQRRIKKHTHKLHVGPVVLEFKLIENWQVTLWYDGFWKGYLLLNPWKERRKRQRFAHSKDCVPKKFKEN